MILLASMFFSEKYFFSGGCIKWEIRKNSLTRIRIQAHLLRQIFVRSMHILKLTEKQRKRKISLSSITKSGKILKISHTFVKPITRAFLALVILSFLASRWVMPLLPYFHQVGIPKQRPRSNTILENTSLDPLLFHKCLFS